MQKLLFGICIKVCSVSNCIIPSIFFNDTTFELTDGTNIYKMYHRNPNLGQYITESLKPIQYISYNNIDYTLICVGREGIAYPQMFEKIN